MSTNEPPQQPPPQPPPPGGPPPGWAPPLPGTPRYAAAPQTEGTAIAALCCAIAAWIVCPLIPAIVALFLAHSSQQKIDASGGRLTGDGLNTAARITAWINIALFVLLIAIFIIIGVTVGFDSGDDDTDFDVDSLRTTGTYLAARLA